MGRPAHTVFLINPASANGSTGRRWPELARRASALGLTGDALFSTQPEHLRLLARRAAEEGATLVVAVGGDGTVNEVASGIVAMADVELAVIPRGTGVDFVRTYGSWVYGLLFAKGSLPRGQDRPGILSVLWRPDEDI